MIRDFSASLILFHSLPSLRQPPPLAIALTLIIITKPLILEGKHGLAIQALAWQRSRLLGDRRGQGRGVVASARVAGHRIVGWGFGRVGAGAGFEVFAQVERVARGEVEAVVVLGDLDGKMC